MNDVEKKKAEISAAQSTIFAPINEIIESAEEDDQKYYGKCVRSAGNRLKKKMQDIRKAIKHPAVKAEMTKIQEGAKNLRQQLVDATKNPA